MATVTISANIEGHISKYDAYRALCEDTGLTMLIDGTTNEYSVENGILYHTYDDGYHGSGHTVKEEYEKNPRTVMLFEYLLGIKCVL